VLHTGVQPRFCGLRGYTASLEFCRFTTLPIDLEKLVLNNPPVPLGVFIDTNLPVRARGKECNRLAHCQDDL
jgi:hypothetical protein